MDKNLKINAIIVIDWDYKNSFYFHEYQRQNNLAALSMGD
jgi:hypothetical protein